MHIHTGVACSKKHHRGNVVFQDGESYSFDVIIFATGFQRATNNWLKVIVIVDFFA